MPLETRQALPAAQKPKGLLEREFHLVKPRVTEKDRMFFTEQLALLLETGTSLHAALGIMQQQTRNPALREMLEEIAVDVSEGSTFGNALARHGEVFSSTYVNLISASEKGGFLPEVLAQLQAMEEKRAELRAMVISSFSYPVFLVFFSIAVVIFILVSVFPRFETMFMSIHDDLPGSTVVLLAMSQILRKFWVLILLGLGGGFVALRIWMRTPAGAEVRDQLVLRIAGIRDIVIRIYLVNSLRALGMSLAHGVNVTDALAACREIVPNRVFQRFFRGIEESVESGGGLAAGFNRGEFIPDVARQMIQTGEESGHLPEVMKRIADYYERELSRQLVTLSKVVEPIMLLVMGVVVGYLVSALIFPIFKLASAA